LTEPLVQLMLVKEWGEVGTGMPTPPCPNTFRHKGPNMLHKSLALLFLGAGVFFDTSQPKSAALASPILAFAIPGNKLRRRPNSFTRLAPTRYGDQTVVYHYQALHQRGQVIGYRLTRQDGMEFILDCWLDNYWPCSCQDFDLRLEECQHARRLRQHLKNLALKQST